MNNIEYKWNEEKNNILKKDRNISFENVVQALEDEKLLEIINNPSSNHSNQQCFVLNIDEYVYLVPFVKNDNELFLKTIFPSRKHTKFYLLKRLDNEK